MVYESPSEFKLLQLSAYIKEITAILCIVYVCSILHGTTATQRIYRTINKDTFFRSLKQDGLTGNFRDVITLGCLFWPVVKESIRHARFFAVFVRHLIRIVSNF